MRLQHFPLDLLSDKTIYRQIEVKMASSLHQQETCLGVAIHLLKKLILLL
jgi:hypothetical protein